MWWRREVGAESAFQAIVADVRANRRGKSISEVADELEARLVAAGIFWPREPSLWIAQDIADPYWPLRHPIKLIRDIRASRGIDDHPDGIDDETTDAADREELLDLLRGHPVVRSAGYSPSAPD